jgi:hypothetical protein
MDTHRTDRKGGGEMINRKRSFPIGTSIMSLIVVIWLAHRFLPIAHPEPAVEVKA